MSFHHVQFFKSRSSTYSSKTFLIHCTDPVSISIWSKVTKLIQSTLILFGYSRKVQSCAPKIPNKIGAEKRKSWTHFVALVRYNDWLLRLFRFKIFSRSVLFLKYLNLRLRYKKSSESRIPYPKRSLGIIVNLILRKRNLVKEKIEASNP